MADAPAVPKRPGESGTVLPQSALYRACDETWLAFESTAELPEALAMFGQERAKKAIEFALGFKQPGYHLFVLSAPESGARALVHALVDTRSKGEPQCPDWCYVNNFDQPDKPRALCLPGGRGSELRRALRQLARELVPAIGATFESAEIRSQVEAIRAEQKEREEHALQELSQLATEQGATLLRTPKGLVFVPHKGGEAMDDETFAQLPEEEQQRLIGVLERFRDELRSLLQQFPRWRREMWERIKQVGRDAIGLAIGHLIENVRAAYADQPTVLEFLDEVMKDVIEHGNELLTTEQGKGESDWADFIQRCQVNLLVEHRKTDGAPVVFEESPTYQNLVGRFDQVIHMGTLVTDLTLIKAGALHRANGGYLLLDADKILSQPHAWEGLKVALKTARIRIQPLGQAIGWANTVPMEPEPVPLDVKVILFGERDLYALLKDYDREFAALFKVVADFEDDLARNEANVRQYARVLASHARNLGLRPLERQAVARLIEHSARLARDAEKLSTRIQPMIDLMSEADYWAGQGGHARIRRDDVEAALREQIHRADRLRESCHEAILRDCILVATDGQALAQVNGLALVDEPGFRFARPVRITATARMGKDGVVDIERECTLGSAAHTKGVMILSAFLASRYSPAQPLSLSASLVIEQSYGPVEGDSASLAELCALLSALSGMPIRQSLAVTGSVNQHGVVQPIGTVNEKIEGFFDICRGRGLTGDQGVLIPAGNTKNLMLREDVVAAAAAGEFHVYGVNTVDQAVEILTGTAAGEPDAEGAYPAGSINFLVAAQLAEWARRRRAFGRVMKRRQQRREA